MEDSDWLPKCKWCEKRLREKIVTAKGVNVPGITPKEYFGYRLSTWGCSESPTREHFYVWERFYR